jgi:hypothetical protein
MTHSPWRYCFRCSAITFGLIPDVLLHCLPERLHRPLGVERVTVEIEARDLALVRLVLECRRRRRRSVGVSDAKRFWCSWSETCGFLGYSEY